MSPTRDVVVVGGGPAGLAAAGLLARRGRSVAVVERTSYAHARVGETFGGEIGPLLDAIGAADAMRELVSHQVSFLAVRAAWGSNELVERASIVHPLGDGIHVDRAAFDARLAEWARSLGVAVHTAAGSCAVARGGDGFVVSPRHGAPVRSRFLLDASGRGAPAAGPLDGRRWLAADHQVAIVARMTRPACSSNGAELLLEAVEHGWWYSVPQPDGTLVVALVTDPDLVPTGARDQLASRFATRLAHAEHTSARTSGCSIAGDVRVVRADSGCLLPPRGRGWRAIGDAAMATDPLAGNGVPRALRSALEAVDAIDRELDGAVDDSPPELVRELADYLDRRATYYLEEARWPNAPFWVRRRPIAWNQAPLVLAPEVSLRATHGAPREARWHAEALLPPQAISAILALLAAPHPAHVVMSRLRELAPLGDRRLLVGLQLLVEHGVLAAS